MAKHERQLRARGGELIGYLDKGIRAAHSGAELVDTSVQRFGPVTVWIHVYEKPVSRNGGRIFLTLQVAANADSVTVTAISTDGKNQSRLQIADERVGCFNDTVVELLDLYEK